MNKRILDAGPQEFIQQNLTADITRLILQKSPFPGISSAELATQIDSKNRCEKKLPLWFNTKGIYFPPKLNIEQASSEPTAKYKSDLANGEVLVDMTGGFGVDDFYFAKKVKKVIHLELDSELSAMAAYNSEVLQAENIEFVVSDSITYLKNSTEVFDTIYADPARRVQSKKVFLLQDTEPEVVSNLSLLQSKASRIIVKTSPLFDIQSGLKELANVSEVHVVSLKNDCKELLWVIDKDFNTEPEIICAAIDGDEVQKYSFTLSMERSIDLNEFSNPLEFLYEADVAVLKAGCFKSIALTFNILKLNINTHLYTSKELKIDFIGRIFRVKQSFNFRKMKQLGIKKANIITRNFPLSPDEIKKKFKVQDGGSVYLIFCKGLGEELLVIEAERLK